MRRILAVLLLAVPVAFAAADVSGAAAQADALHDKGSYADARALMLSTASSTSDPKQVAEQAQKTPGPPSGKPPEYSQPNKKTGKVRSGPHL